MKREIIAILTLGSFIVFSFSCYSVQLIKPEMLSSPKADKIEIRKIEKTSGECIDFFASDPGRIRGNFVTGTGIQTRAVELVEIASADVQTVSRQDETFLSVKTRDGKFYDCKRIVEQGDKSVLHVVKGVPNRGTSFFYVSLSEVEKAWANQKYTPQVPAFLVAIGTLAGCVLVVLGVIEFIKIVTSAAVIEWMIRF